MENLTEIEKEKLLFILRNFITYLMENEISDINDDKKIELLQKSIKFFRTEYDKMKD
jgi:hypothetical protein